MRKITLLFCAIILCQATYASAPENKKQKFTIQGKIDDLQKGDTLYFQKVILPSYERVYGFDIVIENDNGEFLYKGKQEHTWLYIMSYKPCKGEVPKADRMGREIMITANDKITLSGNQQYTPFCKITGGIYDNPILCKAQAIDDSIGMSRTTILQKLEEARKTDDKDKIAEYSNRFNNFSSGEAGKKARELWEEYYFSPSTSEITTKEALQKVSYTPIAELDSMWNKLPISVQKSYHGQILEQTLKSKRCLEPGNIAPDFTLINDNGDKISLANFKGKYLLIYHWGMCPGSMQIDPRVKELYEKCDKQKLMMVGVSSSIENVAEFRRKANPTDSLFDMNILERLNCMLSHPYADFNLNTNDNNNINDTYMFGGLPFFVFISPEQKIITRGFHDAFNKAYNQLIQDEEEPIKE